MSITASNGIVALWKWLAGGLLALVLMGAGTMLAAVGDHGERLVKVESAVIFLKELVEHNHKYHQH